MRGFAKGGTSVSFGDYGLQALEPAQITARQIESARVAITRTVRRGGKVWINIFPDKPITAKPAETRMVPVRESRVLGGRGQTGRVMMELSGVDEDLAREAMRRAGHKLPIKTRFVSRNCWASRVED